MFNELYNKYNILTILLGRHGLVNALNVIHHTVPKPRGQNESAALRISRRGLKVRRNVRTECNEGKDGDADKGRGLAAQRKQQTAIRVTH